MSTFQDDQNAPLAWARMMDELCSQLIQTTLAHTSPSSLCNLEPNIFAHVAALLQRYDSKRADYERFVSFSDSGYTKNLVRQIGSADRLVGNVIVMCWAPGQRSLWHGHEGSQCVVKVLEGEIDEYRCDDGSFQQGQAHAPKRLKRNDVCHVGRSTVHQMVNKSDRQVVTLHVYLPAYTFCRVYKRSHGDSWAQERLEVTFEGRFA